MDNRLRSQALYETVLTYLPPEPEMPDDEILLEAFKHNDVHHACQPIRHINTDQIEYHHLTLRFGSNGEQSAYQFEISETMKRFLDIYSLYLAIHQISFQLETFHPDIINNLAVPMRAEAFFSDHTQSFIQKLIQNHRPALRHIIPMVQLFNPQLNISELAPKLNSIRDNSAELWFDIRSPFPYLDELDQLKPRTLKVSQPLHDIDTQIGLIPIIKYIRSRKLSLIFGQVNTDQELKKLKALGANFYFGYLRDIPVSFSFQGPGTP